MKIKPILFSTPMVQAILENRKTQTRRKCAHQYWQHSELVDFNDNSCHIKVDKNVTSKYQVGDILWVRESVKVGAWNYEEKLVAFDYKASPELKKTPWVEFENHDDFDKIHEQTINELSKLGVEPRIDDETETFQYVWAPGQSPLKWKPSIHMPKAAARIFLEVTNVRVERLYAISEADAIAEGIEGSKSKGYKNYVITGAVTGAKTSFETLWIAINGQESFDANPWVFVYEFKRVERPDNF